MQRAGDQIRWGLGAYRDGGSLTCFGIQMLSLLSGGLLLYLGACWILELFGEFALQAFTAFSFFSIRILFQEMFKNLRGSC